jgi:hypothetical protein
VNWLLKLFRSLRWNLKFKRKKEAIIAKYLSTGWRDGFTKCDLEHECAFCDHLLKLAKERKNSMDEPESKTMEEVDAENLKLVDEIASSWGAVLEIRND